MQTHQWRRLDSQANAPIRSMIGELLAVHPLATLDHDPDWLRLRAQTEDRGVQLYYCLDQEGRLIGYAPFFTHPSALAFSYANLNFLSVPIRRWSITATPLIVENRGDSADLVRALLTQLRRDLGSSEMLFALGLHMESALGQALAQGSLDGYLLLPHGPSYQRRLAGVEKTLDEYLAKLGPKTRADLRRQERRLAKQADDLVECAVVCTPAAMDGFLSDVESVSRRTYQWNLLGMGIQNSESLREVLRAAAARGWFRGYVLRCKGNPVAFMIGYLYRGVYLSESIGYDPQWAEWSVGNVLHLHVMRDLATLGDEARWFDFLYGDNSNKERLSTRSHLEQNFYLAPDTLKWRAVLGALRGFHWSTDVVSRFLERHQLKDKLRRMLRRRATRNSAPSAPADPSKAGP